ncbi:TPA: hypothetical protein ACOJPK_001605 [Pseudomonas putida]
MERQQRIVRESSHVTLVNLREVVGGLGAYQETSIRMRDIPNVYTDRIATVMGQILEHDESVAIRTINVEGWQLVLAAAAILGGSYYFAWDSHKALLAEISGLRQDMRSDRSSSDDDLKALIRELKAEREADRQQAKVDNEVLQEGLAKVREAQAATTEVLKRLEK